MKNPFINARIIGENVGYSDYARQEHRRGEPGYIMSRGELCEFLRCPSRWRAGFREGKTDDMEWGSLIDCLALMPSEFDSRYAVAPAHYPDSKTGEPKEWNWNANHCKAWRDGQKGKQVVKATMRAEAEEAVERLTSDPLLSRLIQCSKKQVHVQADYVDRATGEQVTVRVLLDLVPDRFDAEFGRCLGDLKTGASADPAEWAKTVFKYDLHTQGALYLDCYVAATGEDRTDWMHVIQENFAPWETGRRLLSSEFITLGREKYLHALQLYAQCLARNEWPKYDHFAQYAGGFSMTEPEPWMVMQSAHWLKFPEPAMPTLRRTETPLAEITP